METVRTVALVCSAQSIDAADSLPSNTGRASRVHALIRAFELDSKLDVIEPAPLDTRGLTVFHSEEFISSMFGAESDSDCASTSGSEGNRLERFGLVDDCALFDGVEAHVRYAAGATVAAAEALVSGRAQVAINWEGGRHHGQRSRASGYCYVNDVVLGILALQARFSRVLYIDLDLHHGDGVQDAFLHSRRVMTLSLHHHERGFFPNSGGRVDEGRGRGAGHSINVPLRRGASDGSFIRAFTAVANRAVAAFAPDAVVVQCGSDGLGADPHKVFNLTTDAFAQSVGAVLAWGQPTLLLGGGGYSNADCARCWARLTAVACGSDIPPETDIPEHAFLNDYAPGFDMQTDAMLVEDENTATYLDSIIQAISSSFASRG